MKYKSKDYAKVLAELIINNGDNKKITDNFIKLLQKNGDFKKAKEIITLAEKLYLQKTGRKKVIIETARKVNHREISNIVLKEDIIEERINKELIAGIKIIVNDEKQLDFSLKKKLEEVFKQ